MLSECFLEKGATAAPHQRGVSSAASTARIPPSLAGAHSKLTVLEKRPPQAPSLPQVYHLLELLHTCIYTHTHIDEYRWTLSMYSSIHPPTPNYYRWEYRNGTCCPSLPAEPAQTSSEKQPWGHGSLSKKRENSLLQGSQMQRLLLKTRCAFARH